MSKSNSIRVPATTVDLVLVLGRILRKHLQLKILETECWTFEHVADWEIYYKLPADDADASEREWYEVYLGSGHCLTRGAGQDSAKALKIELRVRCEYGKWDSAGLNRWDFQLWLKLPDGTIQRRHFGSSIEHIPHHQVADREVYEIDSSKSRMPMSPPRKIAFWRQKEAQAS
jgi:hypothetical protein